MTENAEPLVAKLVNMALIGDARMMSVLVDRMVPKIQRHEINGAEAPTKLVIEFQKPEPEQPCKGCSRAAGQVEELMRCTAGMRREFQVVPLRCGVC